MSRAKILIIDDSELMREAVAASLKERGYDVVALECVFDFNEVVRRERPDLALVDVSMPALRGDQLVKIANRNRRASCALVLFSSRPPEELAALADSCGAAGYISKDEGVDALIARIHSILGRYRSRHATAS